MFAAVIVASALAACAPEPGSEPEPAPEPERTDIAEPGSLRPLQPVTHSDITRYCPEEDAIHLAELGYEDPAVELGGVYICEVVRGDGAGAGEEAAYRLAEPLDLLHEYSEANETRTDGACIMMLADPLIVWVEDGEELTAVYAPVDECGFPQEDAAAAYEAAQREQIASSEGTS